MPLSMGTPSSMPRRWSRVLTHSRAKMRMRSSSRERKKREAPGSPWRPARPRSWLSTRRDSWRSVPRMCRPPASTTDSCSTCAVCAVCCDGRVPGCLRGLELLAGVVEADDAGAGGGRDGALGGGDGARLRFLDQVLPGHELGVAAEQDVGAAAGHVGGDGDHAEAAGLGDDLRLLLVELGVEHDVAARPCA